MTQGIQRRHSPSPIRVEKRSDGSPLIVGYAAVFYREGEPGTAFKIWDDVEERIMPGAFDKAIQGDDVRALFNHCPDFVLGRSTAGTLRLSVDEKGLRYEIDPPDTQAARDVLAMLKRGDVSGSSFAFVERSRTIRETPGLYIIELNDVELFDVGPVTYPAYPATSAGAASRSLELARSAEAIRAEARSRGWRRDVDAISIAFAPSLD